MSLELDKRDIDDIDKALSDEELPNKFRRKLLTLKCETLGSSTWDDFQDPEDYRPNSFELHFRVSGWGAGLNI